jgi:hypothetical protein
MLRGSIDDKLAPVIMLTQDDLDLLVQKRVLCGTMRRPKTDSAMDDPPQYRADNPFVDDAPPALPKRKPKAPAEVVPVTHVEVPLELSLKQHFRVGGFPESNLYSKKRAYEIWITGTQVQALRAQGKLEYRSQLPCNALTISLKDYATPAAPAQKCQEPPAR